MSTDILYYGTFYYVLQFGAFIIGILYLYSLFHLYIGKDTSKHKVILLSLNFIFLLSYIVLLIVIPEYNQVPLILLLIVLLSVIVLGIIGSFMYQPSYTRDRSENYKSQLSLFQKSIKGSLIVLSVIFSISVLYQALTHDIDRLIGVTYVMKNNDDNQYCDAHLDFETSDSAMLFFMCDQNEYAYQDVTNVKIDIEDVMIYDGLGVGDDEVLHSYFNYDYDNIYQTSYYESFTVELTVNDIIYTYVFVLHDYTENIQRVTVPVWVNE